MYKIIVAGTRTFDNYELLEARLIGLLRGKRPSQVQIVSGGARGADALGERFAREKNCSLKQFPADWKRQPDGSYDKSAGYKRNAEMADYADACIVFWDGKSKGTSHMIDLAIREGLDVTIVKY